MRQPRERRQFDAEHLAPNVAHAGFHHLEDVFLRAKRHLDVELDELDEPVGALVLVAHTARDLHVVAEAGDHQDLLEHLRRLRQRVEMAGIEAAWHEIVARAFGRRFDHHRRLDLEESARIEEIAHRLDDVMARAKVALHPRAPQIEIAILEAQVFVDRILGVHLKGRYLRAIEDLELIDTALRFRRSQAARSRFRPAAGEPRLQRAGRLRCANVRPARSLDARDRRRSA